jgi:uncharacterized protein (TIGR02145 family)
MSVSKIKYLIYEYMKTNFFKTYKCRATARVAPTFLPLLWMGLGVETRCVASLLFFLCPLLLSAQNGVTVSGLAIDAGTVTFNVSWDKDNPDMPELWSDSVWVFVDYNNAGKMERLPVTGATASAGTVIMAPNNNKGVWVIGNARTNGNFSATVQLHTATAAADFSGACAYASNYPPVGEYTSADRITFTGTPMYDIVLKHGDGSTVTVQSGGTFLLPCDYTLQSFTDATTGAPGIMKCIPMTGSIDFSVSLNIAKGTTASFVVSREPTVPNPASITYRWFAPDFTPSTYAGRPFTTTAPASGTYPVTLTAQSEGYCSLVITKTVEVLDCTAPGSTVNFVNFVPCEGATSHTVWYLTDTREYGNGKTYKVKKMPDERIWMVQDLQFGNCTETSYHYDDSEGATTLTPTVAPGYVGHCRTNGYLNAGYSYNWAAAINNTKAFDGSGESRFQCTGTGAGTVIPNPGSCQSICPEGWHIPTGNTAGEFQILHNAMVNAYKCSTSDCWDGKKGSYWEGVLGGVSYADGSLRELGGHGIYWSSTYYDKNYAYPLYFYGSNATPGTYPYRKYYGFSVRCVRNY